MFDHLKHILNTDSSLHVIRSSKKAIVISVTVGLLLENVVLTVVYPIILEILSNLETDVAKPKVPSMQEGCQFQNGQQALILPYYH